MDSIKINPVILSKRLSTLRAEKRMTQETFAEVLSQLEDRPTTYKVAIISHWETGRKTPTFKTLVIIAEMYHVSIAYLVGLTDNRTEEIEDLTSDEPKSAILWNNTAINKEVNKNFLFDNYVVYDGHPFFILLKDSTAGFWGLFDSANHLFILSNRKVISMDNPSFDEKFSIYIYAPDYLRSIKTGTVQPYSYNAMLNAKHIYVASINSTAYIRNALDGYYEHDITHTFLVNKETGQALPYDGLGVSYHAYSTNPYA